MTKQTWSVTCLLLSLAFGAFAQAKPLPFKHVVNLHANKTGIVEVLEEFVRGQNVNSVIDQAIKGELSGTFEEVDPADFFDQLCQSYGLIWTYDGNILYIDAGDKIASKVIRSPYLNLQEIRAALESLGIVSSHSYLGSVEDTGIVFASGAERFVSVLEVVVKQLNEARKERDETKVEVRVFPLKHAWAYDLKFSYQEGSVNVEGVASILKRLVSGNGDTVASEGLTPSLPLGKQKKLDKKGGGESKGQPSVLASRFTTITNDVRTNSVIVRDFAGAMPLYEEIIRQLDRPVKLIAISAVILDIALDQSENIGLEAFSGAGRNGRNFSFRSLSSDAPNVNSDNIQLGAPVGLLGSSYDMMLRIQALQSKDKVRVLSRPSILTFDNMQAIISSERSVYIRVPGAYDTDLYNVTAGLSLRVIPHVIETESGQRKIKLLLQISDGVIDNDRELSTDNSTVPSVEKNSLTTQAILNENESLLIGGLYVSNEVEGESGVAILKDLPLLGGLFRTKRKISNKSQRLFLITPEVIDIDAVSTNDYKKYFQEKLEGRAFEVVPLPSKPFKENP